MASNGSDSAVTSGRNGFAGLKSMLSDVDATLSRTADDARGKATSATATETSAVGRSAGDHRPTGPSRGHTNRESVERVAPESASPGDRRGTEARRTATQESQDNSNAAQLLLGTLLLTITVVGAIYVARWQHSADQAPPMPHAPAPAPAPVVAAQPESPRLFAVAAVNANLRSQPSTRSKIIGTLKRGTLVAELERRDGFVRFRVGDDTEGWISSDILIEMSELSRLRDTTPDDYIAARQRYSPITKLTEHLGGLQAPLRTLIWQVENRDSGLAKTMGEIEGSSKPAVEVDVAAGIWFSLAARAAASAGDDVNATSMAMAAVYADPFNIDYHTALGYSAIASAQWDLLKAVAAVLPALAPQATNTWIIFGIAAARDGNPQGAHGALLTAIDLSRNRATTVRVLRNMVARLDDAAIVAALRGALVAAQESSPTGEGARAGL